MRHNYDLTAVTTLNKLNQDFNRYLEHKTWDINVPRARPNGTRLFQPIVPAPPMYIPKRKKEAADSNLWQIYSDIKIKGPPKKVKFRENTFTIPATDIEDTQLNRQRLKVKLRNIIRKKRENERLYQSRFSIPVLQKLKESNQIK